MSEENIVFEFRSLCSPCEVDLDGLIQWLPGEETISGWYVYQLTYKRKELFNCGVNDLIFLHKFDSYIPMKW